MSAVEQSTYYAPGIYNNDLVRMLEQLVTWRSNGSNWNSWSAVQTIDQRLWALSNHRC
jgi:hypothetical protein